MRTARPLEAEAAAEVTTTEAENGDRVRNGPFFLSRENRLTKGDRFFSEKNLSLFLSELPLGSLGVPGERAGLSNHLCGLGTVYLFPDLAESSTAKPVFLEKRSLSPEKVASYFTIMVICCDATGGLCGTWL